MNLNVTNLLELASRLDNVPDKSFSMADYLKRVEPSPFFDGTIVRELTESLDDTNVCGTAACACGYGMAWGIGIDLKSEADLKLFPNTYTTKAFNININRSSKDREIYSFLFGGHWAYVDNTPRAAAARVRYVVAHGKPPKNEFKDRVRYQHQMKACEPYHYDTLVKKELTAA